MLFEGTEEFCEPGDEEGEEEDLANTSNEIRISLGDRFEDGVHFGFADDNGEDGIDGKRCGEKQKKEGEARKKDTGKDGPESPFYKMVGLGK